MGESGINVFLSSQAGLQDAPHGELSGAAKRESTIPMTSHIQRLLKSPTQFFFSPTFHLTHTYDLCTAQGVFLYLPYLFFNIEHFFLNIHWYRIDMIHVVLQSVQRTTIQDKPRSKCYTSFFVGTKEIFSFFGKLVTCSWMEIFFGCTLRISLVNSAKYKIKILQKFRQISRSKDFVTTSQYLIHILYQI
jgi:hypothetical protein